MRIIPVMILLNVDEVNRSVPLRVVRKKGIKLTANFLQEVVL